jgi:hypothetical protein
MPLVLKDRVRETSTTTGTGTLTLNGAVVGFQTFSSAIGNTNTTYYAISNNGTSEWEVGLGTVSAGALARNTVYASSNAGSLVNFSAGAKDVFCNYPADRSVELDASGVLTGVPITVSDAGFTIQDNVDPTKQAQFQLSGIATATTRTYTLINADGTIPVLSSSNTWTGTNTFTGSTVSVGQAVGTATYSFGTGATQSGLTKTITLGGSGVSGSTTNITIGSAVSGATTNVTTYGTWTANANQIISVTDNTNAALRITQLGTGNAILVEDTTNPDSTPFVVDANGNVGVGTLTPTSKLTVYDNTTSAIVATIGDGFGANFRASRYSTDSAGPANGFFKYRGSFALPTAVASGDSMGAINFNAYGGTNTRTIASIAGVVGTYTSDTDISSILTFSTAPTGGTTLTERLRITSAGGISFGSSGTAYGTSGQILQSNGDAAPTWIVNESMTLLGTLTTTSGTTQTLSGLTLTNYKEIKVVVNNVSATADANLRINTLQIAASTGGSGNSIWGHTTVSLVDSVFSSLLFTANTTSGTVRANSSISVAGKISLTTASTSIEFSWNTGNFDAGSILVYGVK